MPPTPPPLPEKPAGPIPGNKAPPSGRKFPCGKCGARLDFSPSASALQCPYCGHVQKIERGAAETWENDLDAALERLRGKRVKLKGHSEVRCGGCGAVVLMDDKVQTDRCPYCGTHLENKPESAEAMLPPEWVLPFAIDNKRAVEAFEKWLDSLWFAPNALRKLSNLGRLAGMYVPYWTFDSMTYTWYTGQRGDDYQVTETYTERNAQGQTETKTRTVTKTRWSSVSGQVQHFFDDVLVCGTKSLPEEYATAVQPERLEGLEEYRDDFLSGFQTERYTVGPKQGFRRAREVMDAHIRVLCDQDIGGDHQRLETVDTQHVGVSFKQVLLPVWMATYRFRDQPYRVLINGRTGVVVGDRPWSWVKIALLVGGILALIGTAILLIMFLAR
jgi:DNA-directed RNA polymerase subunit RPC12/RpoP